MALLETLHRTDSKLKTSFREPENAKSNLSSFFAKVSDAVSSGTSVVCNGAATAAGQVSSGATAVATGAGQVTNSLTNAASDVATFFRSLTGNPRQNTMVSRPADDVALNASDGSLLRRSSAGSSMTATEDSTTAKIVEGIYGVDYSKYPISAYVQLPTALQPFVNLPGLDHYLVVGRPTMDKSGGLAGYRDCVPKAIRAAAPFLIIVDEAGKADGFTDKSYLWYEFKLVDVFKLYVKEMKTFDDYLNKLSRKARWNCKDRQKKLAKSPLQVEYIPLPRERSFLDKLLPLYKQTGEKNGFCVLDEHEFYEFHMNTPDLTIMLIKDPSQADRIVTFCTGVRAEDTLMPMWCGTDYEHELAMKCSTYYNMLYEYFKVAIADPTINWVDLGATRRQAKTGIGCDAYPVSGYVRCKNSIMVAIVETMMKEYFKPNELMNDP